MMNYLDVLQNKEHYAFDVLNINKIYGGTEVSVLFELQKKLGSKHEGLLKKHNFRDGVYVDVILTALFQEDSEALNKEKE